MSNHAKRGKRILAGVLAGALALSVSPILGFTGTAAAADPLPPVSDPIGDGNFCEGAPTTTPFTDVVPSDPSFDEIACLVADGVNLTQGTTPTTYSPNGTITRRQMALFITRFITLANELELVDLEDLPAYDGTQDFSDISDENLEFISAIGRLNQAGIVGGFPDGTYRPGEPVSRRQMAAFVNRTEEFLTGTPFGSSGDYFDDDNGDSGEANLDALAEFGIFQGDGAGNVFPGSALTRRQMANILLRHLQVHFELDAITGPFGDAPDGGNAVVNVTNGSVQQGGTVTGTVTGANIQSVRVSGCGLADQALPLGAGGGFSITLPASQAPGTCVLTFVTTFLDGTTETDTVTMTVTAPSTFFLGSPVITQVNFASTGGAPTQGRELYTFTIPAAFPGPVDITLVPSANIRVTGAGVEFRDADNNNQADGLGGACGGQIDLVNGVVPASPTYINDQVIPADRVITVVVNSMAPNTACNVLLFRDLGNDNALTLNANKTPAEPFGGGGAKIWTGPEAPFGANAIVVALAVAGAQADGQPVNALTSFTIAGTRYEWDANDTFQLGGVSITQAQFETIIGAGDSVAIAYDPNPAGVSVFNITNDVGFAAPATPPAIFSVINADAGTTTNDVRARFTAPAGNSPNALYKIQRASSVGADGICGTADDVVAANANFATVGTVQGVPGNTVTFTDLNVPTGCYFYRVQVTNPVSGINSNSATEGPFAVPGAGDGIAPTSVNAIARDRNLIGVVDSTDVLSILFSEVVNADAGDRFRVQDPDGEFADIVLGTGNTFTTVVRGGQTLLNVTLTATPTILGDALVSPPGPPAFNQNTGFLSYPLTITTQSGIQDPAGNNFNTAVPDVTIEADSTGPAVVADTANQGDTSFTVTFGEAVDPASAGNIANYRVSNTNVCGAAPVTGVNPVTNAVLSNAAGTGFTVVTLTTQQPLTGTACLNQSVSDVVGNQANQIGYPLTVPVAPAGPTVTTTAPAAGTSQAVFTSNQDIDPASVDQTPPIAGDFTTSGGQTVTNVVLSGAGNRTITVFLSAPLAAGDNVTLLANALTNTTGQTGPPENVVATATDQTAPTFNSVTAAAAGVNSVTANFSEPLTCASVDLTDFTVFVNGGQRAVQGIVCAGNSATPVITFGAPPTVAGDTVVVNLVGTVTDPAGNAAALVSRSTMVA